MADDDKTVDEEEEVVDRGDGVEDVKEDAKLTEEEKALVEKPKEEEEAEVAEGKEPMLPKRRYDSQARARKAAEEKAAKLEARIAELETTPEAPKTADDVKAAMRGLDKDLEAARADGDTEKVFDLMNQQREIQTNFFMSQLDVSKTEATVAATEQTQLDATVAALENAYDVLNAESESYDEDLVGEINELSEALQLKGYKPADALTRAVDLVYPVTQSADVVDIDTKRKTDVKKNVETANRQPPDLDDVGLDTDQAGMQGQPEINKLSEKEFDELPEEAKKRMRGDIV